MLAGRRRGTAKPRWRWSGVAPLTAARLSARDIDLGVLLPGHQSPIDQVMLALRDLGGKYHRYLHQDEFGPIRAERMAALRLLLDQLALLLSRLNGLPEHLCLLLSNQLAANPNPLSGCDTDNFEAHRNDEEAVQLVGEVAVDVRRQLPASASRAPELMDELCGTAERTVQLLCALDTTTASAVAIDAELPRLEIEGGTGSDLIGFSVVCARIERLRRRAELTLARLVRQKGPERSESLRWLVWQLCDLYNHETGQPVTSSAMADYFYTATPQSPAGRFVLAAVKALQPPEAWVLEPDHRVAHRRTRMLRKDVLERGVHFAMRDYVADHPHSRSRRGRRKRSQ